MTKHYTKLEHLIFINGYKNKNNFAKHMKMSSRTINDINMGFTVIKKKRKKLKLHKLTKKSIAEALNISLLSINKLHKIIS